jgi:hypothetical protein
MVVLPQFGLPARAILIAMYFVSPLVFSLMVSER